MYDSAFNDQFPPGGQAYAGYVDGHVGSQPNYDWATRHFPAAYHLSISVLGNDADCLDIESGAATVAMAAGWYQRQKARGASRPCFYASASMMNSDLIPAVKAAGIPRASFRLWSAHYTGTPHICGPATCKLLSIPADGTQWTDRKGSLNADQSLLADDFFGAEPVLVQGMSGAPVAHLQQRLNAQGEKPPLITDGLFGNLTLLALKAFQSAHGMIADGVVQPVTWAALDKAPGGIPAPGNLKISGVTLTLTWDAVLSGGKPATGYAVEVRQMNGIVADKLTVATTQAVISGLVSGWAYDVSVAAPGGAAATMRVTA
jgi:peptidoglycan hydrolase-like protein with peptidoglycan-binding domain